MTNKNYEVLDTYTFSRFIGIETKNPYAEYKSEHSFLGFTYYLYTHFRTTVEESRFWIDKNNVPYHADASISIDQEVVVNGSVRNYKPFNSSFGEDIRDYYKNETGLLSSSVRNSCPKTILRVNYKNYEYKHVLYPNKIIYIEGESNG
jgi:hypothetical protein